MKNRLLKFKKWRLVIDAVVVGLALLVLLPQFNNLLRNSEQLKSISILWVGIAFLVYVLTNFLAAASYIYLSNRPISYLKATLVQFVNGFTNRVLPSGSGAIATNALFLKKSGHNIEESVSISLINNLLGFFAFLIVMFWLGAFDINLVSQFLPELSNLELILVASTALLIILFCIFSPKIRIKIKAITKNFIKALLAIVKNPISALMALLANCGITLVHVACLTMCLIGVGYALPMSMVAVVFTATITSISASPTPNGLGVTEVVMSTVLQTFGLTESQAIITAFSYRIITYWLPILPGYLAYRLARSKNII